MIRIQRNFTGSHTVIGHDLDQTIYIKNLEAGREMVLGQQCPAARRRVRHLRSVPTCS